MSIESGGAAGETVPAASPSQTPAAPTPATTPGELLRVERERRGLSIQQAADELHLDARLVSAIESNNFLALGAPVYAKGHLRKYASVLGLSPDVVIAHYLTLTDDVPAVPTVMPLTASPPRERISLRVPAWIVAILIIGAVAWWLTAWLLDRRGSSEPAAASGNVAMPVTAMPVTVEPAPDASASGPAPLEQSALPPSTQPEAAQPETTRLEATRPEAAKPATSAAADALTMQLQFAAASWAEIYDASDKRLMFDIGRPGQTRSVSGRPPLTVNLGLASAVNMTVNDRPVAIPRRPGKDATRFMVAADGSVR